MRETVEMRVAPVIYRLNNSYLAASVVSPVSSPTTFREEPIIGGGFALAGSIITGLITVFTIGAQKKNAKNKRQLVKAYKDIASLHRLEGLYVSALETEQKSAISWKREIRKKLRDEGFSSPSDDATSLKAENNLREILGVEQSSP